MTGFLRLLTVLFLLAPLQGAAGDLRTPHCLETCPRERLADLNPVYDQIILVRPTHSLAVDPRSKLARWVAYRITRDSLTATLPRARPRNWKADPALMDAATLEPDDYSGAYRALNFHRGHLAPLASLGAAEGWESLNYLSNIAPQNGNLNSGPWLGLESAERRLVSASSTARVHVLTGPLYERAMPALPHADEDHSVPSGFWKIVSLETDSGIERAAFIFDQNAARDLPFCAGLVPLGDVERRAGLAFAPRDGGLRPRSASPQRLASRLGCAK